MHRLVPTQVVLAQVCSAWRTIAFSIPSLWNVVSTQYLNDHTLTIASELLSRARGSEITLKGYTRFSSKEFDTLIMPNQFKYLRIQLSYERMLQFDSLPSEACVNLESLLLDINIYIVATRKPSFILNPAKYPRLKYLRILLLGLLDGSVHLKRSVMPWHQLTTLSLYIIRSSQLNVLRQCMSLTSLNVEVEWDGINNVKELCLRRLLDFAFTTLSEDVLSLLRIFDFPNLEEIQVVTVSFPVFFSDDIQELMVQHLNLQRICVWGIWTLTDHINIGEVLLCAPCRVNISPSTNSHGSKYSEPNSRRQLGSFPSPHRPRWIQV